MNRRRLPCGLLLAALWSGAIAADDPGIPADTSPICTDRPTKGSYACTVDPGHFQYEADLVNDTFSAFSADHTDTLIAPNPTLKYGVGPALDIEANFVPWVRTETREHGSEAHASGIGDALFRIKYRFLGANDSTLSASLIPYLKLPTARIGIGDGAVEEGVILPVNYKLNANVTLSTSPELDVVKNQVGAGRHINTLQVVNAGIALSSKLIWYAEVSADWNFDPKAAGRQRSADTAFAYSLTQLLQVDVGWNVGLNRQTPALQSYLGIAQKF